jgi:hypothetical protein
LCSCGSRGEYAPLFSTFSTCGTQEAEAEWDLWHENEGRGQNMNGDINLAFSFKITIDFPEMSLSSRVGHCTHSLEVSDKPKCEAARPEIKKEACCGRTVRKLEILTSKCSLFFFFSSLFLWN